MKRYLRFSIGTLLILTAIVAAYFGGYRAGFSAAEKQLEGTTFYTVGAPFTSTLPPTTPTAPSTGTVPASPFSP